MRTCSVLTALMVILLGAIPCQAATLRVARDGSGDFLVVADAVIAAASGDTVTIAPGVYPEVRTFEAPGGLAEYVGRVVVDELTILGDDRDTVILGPEIPVADLETGPRGIVTSAAGNVRVRGVTIRHTAAGVWGNDQWMDVEDCRFVGNEWGIRAGLSGFATVRNCEFIGSEDVAVMVFSVRGGTGALVEDCQFRDNRGGIDFQPSNCEVRDSRFEGGVLGVQGSFGGAARVVRCTFEQIGSYGIFITDGAQGHVYDCRFEAGMAVNIAVSGLLRGSGNELLGGAVSTVLTTYASFVEFNYNHILNIGGLSVNSVNGGGPQLRTQDFTNNYWGTADTDQIDAWIHDRNDAPVVNYVTVRYQPVAEQPISTETSTFGQLKSRFRPDQ